MIGIPFNPNRFNPQPKPEKKEKKKYSLKKISKKGLIKKEEKKELLKEDMLFYIKFYNNHPTKRCFECDVKINYPTSANVHHVVEKRFADRYNIEIRHNEDVCVLVCVQCHSKCETNQDFSPKIKAETTRIKKIFEKYLK